MSNTIPGISRFPCGVLLAQQRIEDVFLEEINKHPNVEICRNVEPTSIEIESDKVEFHDTHAIAVNLRGTAETQPDKVTTNVDSVSSRPSGKVQHRQTDGVRSYQETIRAKYVIGCDGAHSWTRKQLGFSMEGEQTDAESGTIMIIPREDRLVRIYCQLSAMVPGSDGRSDRSRITPDTILQAAQKIMKPYKLEYKYRDWWTVYQVKYNESNDYNTYNLGWKLAMVIKGLAKPSILKTYETERRGVAKELIAFDQEYSRLWSSRPKKDTKDQHGVSMVEFERAFVQQQLFSSGFGVHYGPNMLTAKASSGTTDANGNGAGKACPSEVSIASSHQHLASKTILGQRFPSFKVINHSDARTWHVANWLKSDGLFHVVLFAGDVSQPKQMVRVRNFATEMANRSDTIPLKREGRQLPSKLHNAYRGHSAKDNGGIARLLTIHSAPRHAVEIHDFPPLLLPYDENLG
ncbi:MAG: hypothetical protein Q9171_004484, partial [Xanthocarpia ochracea]